MIFSFSKLSTKKKGNMCHDLTLFCSKSGVCKFKIGISASSRRPIISFFLNKVLNLRTDSFSRLRQRCQDRLLRPPPGLSWVSWPAQIWFVSCSHSDGMLHRDWPLIRSADSINYKMSVKYVSVIAIRFTLHYTPQTVCQCDLARTDPDQMPGQGCKREWEGGEGVIFLCK